MKAILTFHSIDDSGSVLSFGTAMFGELVQGVLDAGISICSLEQLLLAETDHALALTFDDGMQSVFKNALPVLRDAEVPAHLFLTTGYVGRHNQWPTQPADGPRMPLMDWNELEACVQGGMQVECHTHNHPDLRALDALEVEAECEAAERAIEAQLGRRPEHFAYPYGYRNAEVTRITAARYRSCVTTELRYLGKREQRAALPRLDSYYLQKKVLYTKLFSPTSGAYLAGRNLLRKLKQRLAR